MTRRRKLSPTQRAAIFRDVGGKCHVCTRRIAAGERWELDHVLPLALGGKDAPDNLAPCCEWCHKSKSLADLGRIRKADRQSKFHAGERHRRKSRPMPGSKASNWKHRMDGQWERRT